MEMRKTMVSISRETFVLAQSSIRQQEKLLPETLINSPIAFRILILWL